MPVVFICEAIKACVEINKRVNRRVRALPPSVYLQGDRGNLKMSKFPAAGLSEEQIQRFQREGEYL